MSFKKKFLKFLPVRKFTVHEESMMPEFNPGDIVFVSPLPYWFTSPRRGDVVVFWLQDKFLIKKIEKKENSKFFVIGLNQKNSIDSRSFGWIERERIIGKVIYKL